MRGSACHLPLGHPQNFISARQLPVPQLCPHAPLPGPGATTLPGDVGSLFPWAPFQSGGKFTQRLHEESVNHAPAYTLMPPFEGTFSHFLFYSSPEARPVWLRG